MAHSPLAASGWHPFAIGVWGAPPVLQETMIIVKKGCLRLVEGYRHAVASQERYPVSPRGAKPLLASWKRGIHGPVPQKNTPGARGEVRFVHLLAEALDDRYYLVHNVLLVPNWNIDLALAGPSGLWLWESKYWQGTVVRFPTGHWQQWKSTSVREIEFAPDEQWALAARALSHILRRRAGLEMTRTPILLPPQGGIVFTHERVNVIITGDCRVLWGTSGEWIERVRSAPAIEGLEEEHLLHLIEVVLARHRDVLSRKEDTRAPGLEPCGLSSSESRGETPSTVRHDEAQSMAWGEIRPREEQR